MAKSSSPLFSNSAVHYFIIQSFRRGIILLRLILITFNNNAIINFFFFFLILKLGGAPFHSWYLKVIQKLSWGLIWTLSIWQKIIPLLIISTRTTFFFLFFGLLRTTFGRVIRVAQNNLKKILGLSSIFRLGWIFLSLRCRKRTWILFILGYGRSLIALIFFLFTSSILKRRSNSKASRVKIFTFFSGILIIRGLPPFIIFFLKILIIGLVLREIALVRLFYLILRLLLIFVYINIWFNTLNFSSIEFTKTTGLRRLVRPQGVDILIFNLIISVIYMNILFCN